MGRKRKRETEYDGRLARLAADWFRQARDLDVYLQYEFTGLTAAPGREGVLEAVDGMIRQVIRSSGGLEREDRWINLSVDRQPEGFHLLCVSAGICPVNLTPLAGLAAVSLRQNREGYDFTVDWRIPGHADKAEGEAPG